MAKEAKRLAFINNKGGVSKSTTVFHVAGELAHRGLKVLVIDLDPQINSSRSLLLNNEDFQEVLTVLKANNDAEMEKREEDKEITKTIYGYMCEMFPLTDVVYKAFFVPYNGINPKYFGVDVIASDYELDHPENIKDVNIKEELDAYIKENGYDWVLVDVPPSNAVINELVYKQIAQNVICPFSCDEYALEGYDRLIGLIRKNDLNIVGTFLSNYDKTCGVDKLIKAGLEKFKNFIPVLIPHSADIREGRMYGKPMQFYKPSKARTFDPEKKKSAKAYEALVDEIINRLK